MKPSEQSQLAKRALQSAVASEPAAHEHRPIIAVAFRAERGVSPVTALRSLLKAALRRHGLRAVAIEVANELSADPRTVDEQACEPEGTFRNSSTPTD